MEGLRKRILGIQKATIKKGRAQIIVSNTFNEIHITYPIDKRYKKSRYKVGTLLCLNVNGDKVKPIVR